MSRVPMTPEGYQKLTEELEHLKKVERPKVIDDIATARAHGDLSENAEYDAAKERQGFIEARIRELEAKIGLAEVIDPATVESDRIQFGATVRLLDLDTDKEVTYQIVGDDEADPKAGRLNVHSPVARALIGKRVGDEVEVHTPGGERAYEVLDILYK
ncbi:MAG: transcription elongation factor GreA [Candidatus Dadabacteria bacterium]|nr:MAG: transcription elongation factor GreA [Candidatus Dadabacteria bacterium]